MKERFSKLFPFEHQRKAFKITVIYFAISLIWILSSDLLVSYMSSNSDKRIIISMVKGSVFVALTSLLIFVLIKNALQIVLTEKKRSKEFEKIYKLYSDNIEEVIWQFDFETMKFVFVSPSILKLLGYTPEEIYRTPLNKMISDEHISIIEKTVERRENFKRGIEQQKIWVDEISLIHKNGKEVYVEIITVINNDPDDSPHRVIGISRNIQKRKKTEKQLLESERKFKTLFSLLPVGISLLDEKLNYIESNPSFEKITGLNKEQLKKKEYLKGAYIRKDGTIIEMENFPNSKFIKEKREVLNEEVGIIKKNEELIWTNTSASPLEGFGVAIVVSDITELKNTIKALEESENRYKQLVTLSPESILLYQEGIIILANPATVKLFGASEAAELVGLPFAERVHPDSRTIVTEYIRQVIETETQMPLIEGKLLKLDGSIIYVEAASIRFVHKNKPAVQLAIRDITERKFAEEALRQSEEKYRLLAENVRDVIWTMDENLRYTYVSPSVKHMLGFEPEEALTKNYNVTMTPESLAVIENAREKRRRFEAQGRYNLVNRFEIQQIHKNGSLKWVEILSQPLLNKDGKRIGLVGTTRDISERKLAESILAESKAQILSLLESTNELIWSVDSKTFGLLNYNRAFSRMFLNRFNIVVKKGMTPDQILPPLYFETWYDFYHRALNEGQFAAEYMTVTKTHYFHLSFYLLKREGEVFGISVFGKDISERKKKEEGLKTTLSEKETLIKELYHRTKNNMQVISSLLSLKSSAIHDAATTKILQEMINRIQAMAIVHQNLYQSQNLSRIRLDEYVNDLTSFLRSSYKVTAQNVNFDLELENVSILLDSAIPCGLLINELISNSLKFAFPHNTSGEIKIILKKNENTIELVFSDNGIGIDPYIDLRQSDTLGMQLVFALAENQLHGNISIDTKKGFQCCVYFKDELYEERV